MKKAIIIILVLLVVLGGVGAVLWFFTPLFDFLKPARDNFAIQAKKLFGAKTEMSYDDYIKSIEPLKAENSKSYVMKANVSANITLPNDMLDYTTQRRINNTTIKFENSYDANTKATGVNFNMQYSGNDVLNLKMVKDGSKVTLASKDFYDKAITMDMSKLREFCKKNNIDVSEEELSQIEKMYNNNPSEDMANIMYDLMYLTEDEYKALHKNYGDILKKYIDKDNFTTKKNQKISVNGDEIKATGYSLTISGKDVYNIIKKIAEDAKDDSNLKGIVAKKLNILKKYMATTSESNGRPTELDEFLSKDIEESDIEGYINEFLSAFEDAEEDLAGIKKSAKITIYADKKSNPVKLDVAIVKNKEDDGNVIFSGEYGDKKNTYTIDLENIMKVASDITGSEDMTSNSMMMVDKVVIVDEIKEKSDAARKGKMKVSVKAAGQKLELAQIDYDLVTSKSEMKRNIKVSVSDKLASMLPSSASFELKAEMTGLDTDNVDMVFDLEGQFGTYKVNVKADGSIKYGSSNIETYNETNSVDLFTKSEEEIKQIISDIITKASDVLPARLAYYGINVTKQQILQANPTTTTTVTVPDQTVQPAA